MARFSLALALVLAVVCAAAPVLAAAGPASIQGRVIDPSGQPVAGAAVTLRAPSGAVRSARTASDGSFAFADPAPGAYDVIVSADGFRAEPARVIAGAGETASVEVALRLTALTDAVVVSASYVDMPTSEATNNVLAI